MILIKFNSLWGRNDLDNYRYTRSHHHYLISYESGKNWQLSTLSQTNQTFINRYRSHRISRAPTYTYYF
ncbi:FHA domain-containing protein [Vibrio tubiashii]|uniref:FHA domain-containing protein n=1 Tax=Vibrio tubiashii TaxID=29498 RepID=UPI001110DAFB